MSALPDQYPPPCSQPDGLRVVRAYRAARGLLALLVILASCGLSPAAEEAPPPAPAKLEPVVVGTPTRLEVFPHHFKLDGPRDRVAIVVTGHYEDGRLQDLTRAATFRSGDEKIVRIDANTAIPAGNGSTQIIVEAGGQQAVVSIEVVSHGSPRPVPFRYGAVAALTKQGCNAASCHGSPTGKGGFRLSLRGHDPVLDARTLIREADGRRTNPLEPEKSLILLKPTTELAHAGGRRLALTDPAYGVLRDWIAEGCRLDPPGAPACVRIEVYPPTRTLRWPAHAQQLSVLAHFSDGSVRDVTPLAAYVSSDETVATVSPGGLLVAGGRGETTVVVRYLEAMATVPLTFLREVPGWAWKDPPANNYVDELVYQKLRLLQIEPSPLCSDSEFVRRVYLDVLGVLPTKEEAVAFLDDKAPDKRDRLIDALLERPEYAEFWALKWSDLLRVKGSKVGAAGVHKFHRWLVEAVRTNMPYDRFARALLTARGSTFENPPANYFRAAPAVADLAETTAQLFLGARIGCAKCHNHPAESWTQDDYYRLGAFFARVQLKPTGVPDETVVFLAKAGEVTQPNTKQQLGPGLPPSGELTGLDPKGDRREALADRLTRPDHPLFARVAVNRIWGHLTGRGIVEPVDDFRESNPPGNVELLDRLAADFVRSGYDSKHIVRTVLRSRTYQLTSRATDANQSDEKYFSHARARLLTAEQLLDAVCRVTGAPETFAGLPAGMRAGQRPGPDTGNDFLRVFGQPGRESACACERTSAPKLTQALQLINGDVIARKVRSPAGWLADVTDGPRRRLARAARPPTQGLALWLRADEGALAGNDDTAGPPDDGAAVASWRDQSGSGRHATQADANHRPVFVTDGIGGLPTLRFDGQDDLLYNTADNPVPAGGPRTVLLVGRIDPAAAGGAVFTFRHTATVFAVQHGLFAGSYYVYSDGVNTAGNATLPPDTLAATRQPFVTAFVSAGQGQKLAVSLNGADLIVTQPGGIGPDEGAAGFSVGGREDYGGAGFRWAGDVSEVLVYDRALTPEELNAAGGYLAAKYDLPTKYPAPPPPAGAPAVAAGKGDREVVTELYLSALARHPSEQEMTAALEYIKASDDRRAALEDLCWVVLNSKEFLFQH